ncbi:ArsR family transcriptional regulator [Nocardia sp. 348MFTsu5.1]|uniref:arsenate reductase/protein-tyrosine-phosphatase family protein n=1 Tax=Nocardia sp. 348MFTsu5.1 TaxID=1172185 RepID=UPI000377ACB4|nr:ArsR family transcriptional regulator [Nocardia sp. 348MFTsu5.1]
MESAPAVPPIVQLAANPLRWQLLGELAGSDYRVRELTNRIGQPQNLVSYHLRLLRQGGLIAATRSTYDGRDSYYRLDLEHCAKALTDAGLALHPALRLGPAPAVFDPQTPPAVLFVCSGNSARSVIAEALLRHHAGERVTAASAGSNPKSALHPNAIRVLRQEFGIDIRGQSTRHLDSLAGHRFDAVITLCDKAREVCPEYPAARRIHWSTPDPAATDGGSYPIFQRVAADIDGRVRCLLPVLAALIDKEGERR